MPRLEDSFALLRAYIFFDDTDLKITQFMRAYGLPSLRISMALVFIWSGILHLVGGNGVSSLLARTIYWFDPSWFVPFFGLWEISIGVSFLSRRSVRIGILLLLPQMLGTLLPLLFLPDVVFEDGFLVLSLEGLYLVRNAIIIAAAIVLGSSVRDVEMDAAAIERQNYGRNAG